MTKVKCGFGFCKYREKGICQNKEIQINVCHNAFKLNNINEEEYARNLYNKCVENEQRFKRD